MIGMMDWGIGGLSVYRALRERGCTEDVVYHSDSGFTPYGKLSAAELRDRLVHVGRTLEARGARCVVAACHAASAALVGDEEIIAGLRFTGLAPAVLQCARQARASRVGVIGGDLTIASRMYEARICVPGKHFRFASAQPLSAFVESGEIDGPRVEAAILTVLNALDAVDAVAAPIDGVLLACTHYPALTATIRALRPELEILDPSGFVLDDLGLPGQGTLEFQTSGSVEESAVAARRAFGLEIT